MSVLRKPHKKWSTYAALASWGASSFMAQPTMASFVVHFAINPIILMMVIILAHHEAKA
ncbi:hypothetical protein ACRQ5Q_14430 [Bradyrhizobium sp. PMVTL-01]|uniref:hypothetical protein n=1 Tax=Bradyrhizobium sp. PMVTL-01 TaxID=3434999 RepID=UPI003F6E9365